MMANIFLKLLFTHWLAFLDTLQQFFWNFNYTTRPLLATVFPGLIEGGAELSPIVHVPWNRDPSDYINTVDLATMCLAPMILQPPLIMNLSCGVDRPEGFDLLDDASSTESSHSYSYVFLDIPVWGPAVPGEDVPTASHDEDDDAQMNMTPYGARGLSFCPILVAIVYIHSLVHLYMLLMIPSVINHWFEDVLVYDSLDPACLLHFSWFLHASLWTAPWHPFRYGLRKTVPWLYRHFRRATYQSAQLPIPRIVLIRVDGEAVPVNVSEDHQAKADADIWSSLETMNMEVGDGRAVTSGNPREFTPIPSLECEQLPTRAVSHQGRVAKAQGGSVGPESLASEFPDGDPQIIVNEIPLAQEEFSPGGGNKPSHSVEKDICPSEDIVVMTSDSCDVDEVDFEHMAFPRAGGNDVCQGDTDCHEGREDPDQDEALNSGSLVDDRRPDESETLLEIVIATNSSVASQETSAPAKNVRFAVCDDAGAVDPRQASLSASHIDEDSAWPGPLNDPVENDGVGPVEIPVVPFNSPMDATSQGQVTQLVPSEVPSEDGVEEIDIAQPSSPSFAEKPIVNLPSLVATRAGVRFVEMDPMIPAALIEDVTTRSPLQMLCPIIPAVVLNMNCTITPNDKAARRGILDTVDLSEDRSFLPSPSIEGLQPVCSPIIDTEPPSGDDRTPVTLTASAVVCEIGMPVAKVNLIADTSPSIAREVPQTNESQARILYETSRSSSGGRGLLPAASESLGDPGAEDHANPLVAAESDSMGIASGQPVDRSFAVATDLPTTEPSEGVMALPCKGAGPLSIISERKKTGSLDSGENHETDNIPWDHPSTILKHPSERTLSGSMHAPSPQPNNCIDRTPVIYEMPPPLIPLGKASDGNAGTITITEKRSERGQDLSASIHAPKRMSKAEMQSSVSQSGDKVHPDHRRSVTNPVVVSDRKPATEPCSPNWAAMPDVVNAFRMFKEARSGNTIRRVSSIADCTNKVPMVGVVGQKGVATSSLNNASATADIQSRWMHGNRLLLVRDLVSSDPADFNLRTCTNLRAWKMDGMNTIPVQQVLYPGVLDVSSYALQGGITRLPAPVNANLSSVVQTEIQRQPSMLVPRVAEMEPMFGSQLWTAYRGPG